MEIKPESIKSFEVNIVPDTHCENDYYTVVYDLQNVNDDFDFLIEFAEVISKVMGDLKQFHFNRESEAYLIARGYNEFNDYFETLYLRIVYANSDFKYYDPEREIIL